MTIFTNNILEKSFTPYFASLAPKQYCHRHVMRRFPNQVSMYMQDSRTKSMFRWLRRYVLQNTRLYHLGILIFAFGFEHFTKGIITKIYITRNYEVFLIYNYLEIFGICSKK